jgi:hypothetical protein
LGFGGSDSASAGAATPLWLATSDEAANVSGSYFERGRAIACRFSRDSSAVERLAILCDEYE